MEERFGWCFHYLDIYRLRDCYFSEFAGYVNFGLKGQFDLGKSKLMNIRITANGTLNHTKFSPVIFRGCSTT